MYQENVVLEFIKYMQQTISRGNFIEKTTLTD